MTAPAWLDSVKFDDKGLVAAVAQDAADGTVLMVAWMNREALLETLKTGRSVYWSRSRGRLWRKGEESGHFQEVSALFLDCDRDVVLLKVKQVGGAACHTGRRTCFHDQVGRDGGIKTVGDVLFDPSKVYKKK
jgi:phosphoribosyl-AMP cyclohydrolase